jgi:REP element-mobilizing transposase RayT
MFQISRRTPTFYFTSVTHKRLPIFRTDKLKRVLCDAYREACDRHGILMLAYVIMPDHTHLLTRAEREMDEVLRLLNGVAAKRIIDYLKDNGFEESLFKLRGEVRNRNHRHSVW